MYESHILLRETYEWGTYGKNGDEPLRHVLVKDISDNHLIKIIEFIKTYFKHYSLDPLNVMTTELSYRNGYRISVPEYGTYKKITLTNKKQKL